MQLGVMIVKEEIRERFYDLFIIIIILFARGGLRGGLTNTRVFTD